MRGGDTHSWRVGGGEEGVGGVGREQRACFEARRVEIKLKLVFGEGSAESHDDCVWICVWREKERERKLVYGLV